MRNFLLVLGACTLFLLACNRPVKGTNGVVYRSPVEYNDYIVKRQEKVINGILQFSQTDIDGTYKLLDKYEAETAAMVNELKGMPPYKGDSSFRNAGIELFTFYKKIFHGAYRQILDIRKSGDSETEEGQQKIKAIVNDLSREEEVHDRVFHDAQVKFAKDNNMRMEKNKLQDKLDEAANKSN